LATGDVTVEFRGTLRPLYQELLNNPPRGVSYRIYDPTRAAFARRFWEKTGVPGKAIRRAYWRIRYNRLLDKGLIHLSNYWDYSVIRMGRRFVADTENVGTFVSDWRFEDLESPSVRASITKSIGSSLCRKIMPLTHAAKKSMEARLDLSGVEDKVEVVYPAIRPLENHHRSHDGVRILFVGHTFLIKGGRELLQAFRIIRKSANARLTIVSDEAYRSLPAEDRVKVFPSIPRERVLAEFFPSSDIFCMPTYSDSFGFVFLEAMSAGLPILSTNHFHVPEIVEDGKTGLLIAAPVSCWNDDFTYNSAWQNILRVGNFAQAVSELADKLLTLVEDASLRRRMGQNARREVEQGKFSIENRNEKLRRIYEEAARK